LKEASTRIAWGSDIFADIRPARGVIAAIVDLVGLEDEEYDDP
jgi:hypothetical protein